MQNAGLDKAQAGIKIARRNINNLKYADGTTLMAESKQELKSKNLMKMKEESEKAGFKLNSQKMKIMASGPITLWQIDGETMETVTDFIFWGCKITVYFSWISTFSNSGIFRRMEYGKFRRNFSCSYC